ncbi:MAG: HD domain-containing protein [Candidatus Omnitrophica bacterium]|nr:HD domain-containing protein [Candidatus Omnitrophota bacterium]
MRNIFHSFAVRATAVIVLSMTALVFLSGILIYQFTFRSQFEGIRERLKVIAQTAALTVDADEVRKVPLNVQGVKTPEYQHIIDQLSRIKAANEQVKFIYILTKTDASDIWHFLADPDAAGGGKHTSFPGDRYDAGRFPELLRGFDRPSADKKLEVDEWGKTLSGYAPIRDARGQPIAVLGVDIEASDIYAVEKEVMVRALITLAAGIIFALALGFLISSRVVAPIRQLIAGTRTIAEGNLHHQVQIARGDEIGELAESFNAMAKSLDISRKKLVSYFFDTVKSLVTVLEVRDQYTLGHSESVAYFSKKIASKMGIDPQIMEVFRNVTLLHDIGKVGVRDSVLNKPENLDEEEWKAIKLHPVLGEQILKPILQDKTMLAVIRNHHERFDGQGYPDGWAGEQIPLLVAIVSVADSFDAMTSTRSYRKAMSREAAVEQLVKNRGTQFRPDVVDAFLKVLAEEPEV